MFKDIPEDNCGSSVKHKRRSTLKRIEEYERFEVHCKNMKKLNKEKRNKMSKDIMTNYSNLAEDNNISPLAPLIPELDVKHQIILREIAINNLQEGATLEERIEDWRRRGGSQIKKPLARATSLPALSEEDDELDTVSCKSKIRSKSIDSENFLC